jgi:hypothetical protein
MAKLGKYLKPLDAKEATLDVDSEVLKQTGKSGARTLQIEKFGGFPGKNSRRIAFNIVLQGGDAEEMQKHPVVLRISARDARQLSKLFKQMADAADGIE